MSGEALSSWKWSSKAELAHCRDRDGNRVRHGPMNDASSEVTAGGADAAFLSISPTQFGTRCHTSGRANGLRGGDYGKLRDRPRDPVAPLAGRVFSPADTKRAGARHLGSTSQAIALSKAPASYQDKVFSKRHAWKIEIALTVRPARGKHQVKETPGRFLGSTWFLDIAAIQE